jgi:hypothetical protein
MSLAATLSLEQLEREAGNTGLCRQRSCWCRVPHWHPFVPLRTRVDMVLTCDTSLFRPDTDGPKL